MRAGLNVILMICHYVIDRSPYCRYIVDCIDHSSVAHVMPELQKRVADGI